MQEPKFLVQETRVEADHDGADRTVNHWYPMATVEEVDGFVNGSERCGFGTDARRITYRVYDLSLAFRECVEVTPRTMAEAAFKLHHYAHNGCTRLGVNLKVDVALKGRGYDPKTVFWDSGHTSFVIVQPREGQKADARLTSDQGVMLLAVNGIGEVRWDVDGGCASWGENEEAVDHFGLTWNTKS